MTRAATLLVAVTLLACAGDDPPARQDGAAPSPPAADSLPREAGVAAPAEGAGADSPAATTPAAPGAADSVGAPSPRGSEPGPWTVPPLSGEGDGEIRGVAILREVRIARHAGYDRIVFEFADHLPPWEIRAVRAPVQCGSGHPLEPGGATALELDFRPAAAHTDEGVPTVRDRDRRPSLPALRSARLSCDFEAVVTWLLGADHGGQVRVLELDSPPRLAVDLRHR